MLCERIEKNRPRLGVNHMKRFVGGVAVWFYLFVCDKSLYSWNWNSPCRPGWPYLYLLSTGIKVIYHQTRFCGVFLFFLFFYFFNFILRQSLILGQSQNNSEISSYIQHYFIDMNVKRISCRRVALLANHAVTTGLPYIYIQDTGLDLSFIWCTEISSSWPLRWVSG